MSKLRMGILLIVGFIFIAATFMWGMHLFKNPASCPSHYTQQQITTTGCDNGLLMGVPWPGWVWALLYAVVIEAAIAFIIRAKRK